MRKPRLIASALLFLGAITLFIVQQRTIQRLRTENSRASEAAGLTERNFSEKRSLDQTQLQAELERLRVEHAELLRLRGEVARLRQEMAQASAKASTPVRTAAPTTEPNRPPEAVQTFVANADAVVPAGRGLVFGGWPTPPGKCTLVFVQPKVVEVSSPGHIGSVMLEGKFLEVPDEALSSLGLDTLKAATRATSVQTLLAADEMKSILEKLEKLPGVNVLSAPRVQTGDGTQAVISVTEQKSIAGQEYTLGPSLDVDPRIAADGSSINLTVSARFKKESATE
jgi:hypothetical protein